MSFEDATRAALAFRDEREWQPFHTPKDLALSLCLEAAELLEVFQWSGEDLHVTSGQAHAIEELADVAIYCIYMADALGVDLAEAIEAKVAANAVKYPVEKAKGNSRKYTELRDAGEECHS